MGLKLIEVSARCWAVVNTRNLICDANSGFVKAGEGLVVDTQADLGHAEEMRRHFGQVWERPPGTVVNTHEDIDHVAGNQLFGDAEIIAQQLTAEHMASADKVCRLQKAMGSAPGRLGLRVAAPGLHGVGRYLAEHYDFTGVEPTKAQTTFAERLDLDLDGLRAELIHVGPAHSRGDTIVHVPEERVVFAGDVVFCEVAPMGWEGTHEGWIAALDLIESLEPEAIVPGHGPVCTVEDMNEMRAYMQRVRSQAEAWRAQGLSSVDAAARIDVGEAADWKGVDARVWFMVERTYREHRGMAEASWNVKRAFDAAYRVCRARGAEFEI